MKHGNALRLSLCGSFLSMASLAQTKVACDTKSSGSLQRAIDLAQPGDVISISGTCNENVVIAEEKSRITLDGGGRGTINGSDRNRNTISVYGRGTVITGLTITGGMNTILITRGGYAKIDGNTIERSGRFGILIQEAGSAIILNNTIQYHPNIGIVLNGASFANIGFDTLLYGEVFPAPNLVRFNGRGIQVERAAAARIAANDISGNTREGVWLDSTAQATISSNTISDNGFDGILASRGGGANLGQHTGDGLLQQPNRTTVANGGFGIRCEVGGYASGKLGTLNGAEGAQTYASGCINDLEP